MSSTYTLLLTSCIQPQANSESISRSQPETRMNDYSKALTFWLEYDSPQIRSIIIVENSGYNLRRLRDIIAERNKYSRNVEILQYVEQELFDNVHYGYYEYNMLDYAYCNSRQIHVNDFVIKVTGRLLFPNLKKLIHYHERKNLQFLCDSRDYSFWGKISNHSILTTLFIYNPDFYKKYLIGRKKLMFAAENFYIENVFYKLLKPIKNQFQIELRFPFNVEPIGHGGHNNNSYQSFQYQLKSSIRGIFRYLIPKFHI